MPFEHIVAYILVHFGERISVQTVKRAYDHAHPEALEDAAEKGQTPNRGPHVRIGEDRYNHIRDLLRKGESCEEIARKVG